MPDKIIGVEEHKVQYPPFMQPRIAPGIPTQKVYSEVDFTKEYVAASLNSTLPMLRTLPRWTDDIEQRFGCQVYRRMVTDSEVSASLDVLVLASTSSPIKTTPSLPPDHPEYDMAMAISIFFNWIFQEYMDDPLDITRMALTEDALTYGNAAGEMVWDVINEGPYRNYLALKRIRSVEHNKISYVVDNYNNVIGIVPNIDAFGSSYSSIGVPFSLSSVRDEAERRHLMNRVIPRSKFVVFSWREKYSDPRGMSALRPAYTPWWIKQQTLTEMMSWIEKYAQPSIVGKPPANAIDDCVKDDFGNIISKTTPVQAITQALSRLKSASVLGLPYGSEVDMLNVTGSGEIFLKVIAWADQEISRAILKQHLATSEGIHQSRAAAETHQDVLSLFIISIKNWQAMNIRRDIMRPLVIQNFGDRAVHLTPKIDLGDGDGFPINLYEVAQLTGVDYFQPDQLREIDRLIGVPIREEIERSMEDASTDQSEPDGDN